MGSLLPSAVGALNPHELAAPNSATEVLRSGPIEPAGFRPVALEGDTPCGVENVTG
jgi:hypothetical protein